MDCLGHLLLAGADIQVNDPGILGFHEGVEFVAGETSNLELPGEDFPGFATISASQTSKVPSNKPGFGGNYPLIRLTTLSRLRTRLQMHDNDVDAHSKKIGRNRSACANYYQMTPKVYQFEKYIERPRLQRDSHGTFTTPP